MGLTRPRVRIIHHKNITRTADIDIQTFLQSFIIHTASPTFFSSLPASDTNTDIRHMYQLLLNPSDLQLNSKEEVFTVII